MSMKAYDERIDKLYPRLHLQVDNSSPDWHHRSGYWIGAWGTVVIATWSGSSRGTRMELVSNGMLHTRIWHRCFGDRTLSRLAREMAEHYTP